MTEERFNTKIKPILQYVGTIGAVLTAIAYIAIVLIMVFGFSVVTNLTQSIVFAAVNAIMGLIIMQLLKVQGIDLAKNLDKNTEILTKYNMTNTKDKKFHSLRYFWYVGVLKDVIIKGLTLIVTTLGIIYIVICGNSNYSWLLLAVVNLVMFACFGLLSLVRAYDFFNESYIPYITEKLNETDKERIEREAAEAEAAAKEREKIIEAEIERRMALALQEREHSSCSNCGNNVLESSVDMCHTCSSSESVVLDSGNSDNSVLVCTTDARNNASNCVDCAIE